MPVSFLPPPAPGLPEFSTLLLSGYYPPTSAIHLCHSALRRAAQAVNEVKQCALIIHCGPEDHSSRTRQAFEEYNDEWLNENSGKGDTSHLLQKIEMVYPPTPIHLSLLLSLLRTATRRNTGSSVVDVKVAVLDSAPIMVVLQDLSNYFIQDDGATNGTLSSYLGLVMETAAAVQFLTQNTSDIRRCQFVLLDARFGELRLPLLTTPSGVENQQTTSPTASPLRHRSASFHVLPRYEDDGEIYDDMPAEQLEPNQDLKYHRTRQLIEQHFEWVGYVQSANDLLLQDEMPGNLPFLFADPGKTHRVVLCQNLRQSTPRMESPITWEWSQVQAETEHSWTGGKGTKILWDSE